MIPDWIKKNADKYLDWDFYGRCIKRDGEVPWVFLEGREFKEASFEEIANFEYDCQRTAATLVNCDGEEYLLIFPTNKIKYLRSDLKQLMGFKNVEILKLGYFERRIQMKKYYVTMTDKFLSGWGLARGKISKIVIECDTLEEAQIVKENALNRSDMINVRIRTRKPKYDEEHYVVAYETKETYPNWFIKDYFKN